MTGLYYYKLVSPYQDDVTKDCKLTVNEIDHNFVTLKDVDINDAQFDNENKIITLFRNNGEEIEIDMSLLVSGMTTNLEVSYDKNLGIITISNNGTTTVIDGIITTANISKAVLSEVLTDSTLHGNGKNGNPVGLRLKEFTGAFKTVKKYLNLTQNDVLPSKETLLVGDRYIVRETFNEYGYLYNFNAVEQLNEDLEHGWRIPSKEDWDGMLNAIEPCDDDKNHNSDDINTMLGKVAGSLLKKRTNWSNPCCPSGSTVCPSGCSCNSEDTISELYVNPRGQDSFGMGILPSGYGDGCSVMDFFGKKGEFWTSTKTNTGEVYVKRFDYDKAGVVQNTEPKKYLLSIRLVKDYTGDNFYDIETINKQEYPCALMPSTTAEHGFSIWTKINIAFTEEKYHGVLPNNGEGLESGFTTNYYLYVWNGYAFEKKLFEEGDSVVITEGLDGEYNGEYRLMNGMLVNTSDTVYYRVMTTLEPRLTNIERNISTLSGDVKTLQIQLEEETSARTATDASLQEQIDNEVSARTITDASLQEQINNEVSARTETDASLQTQIDEEIVRAKAKEEYLQGRLISKSGSTYNLLDGKLTLKTDDEDNTIIIDLSSNYGTF